jgi:hypothetical protein
MKLSKNFSLAELCKSQTATRKGINNIPDSSFDSDIIDNLKALCQNVLQPIRDNYNAPFSPSSGYRCPELNTAIGGSKTSQHSRGLAADIEIAGVPNAVLAQWIEDNLDYDQLILEFYKKDIPNSGWVHVSYNIEESALVKNRKESLTYDGKKYMKGLIY